MLWKPVSESFRYLLNMWTLKREPLTHFNKFFYTQYLKNIALKCDTYIFKFHYYNFEMKYVVHFKIKFKIFQDASKYTMP